VYLFIVKKQFMEVIMMFNDDKFHGFTNDEIFGSTK